MQENTAKLTYRDVFLTDDVFARNEDGFEFRGLFYRRSSLVFGVGVKINGNRLKKTFRTIEVAVEFYHAKKKEYVDSRKEELDMIDKRLYPNICRILEERRIQSLQLN